MSDGIFGILSVVVVVVCSAPTAYISLCRNIYLKTYYIQNCPNVAGFLKKKHKSEWHFCLVTYILTKPSQKLFLINYQYTHFDILTCQM